MRAALAAAILSVAATAGAADLSTRSAANLDAFRVSHVDLDLTVDFDWHELRGEAILTVQRLDPHATQLIVDTRGLEVTGVDELSRSALGATEPLQPFWVSRPFHPGPADPAAGTALVIDLPASGPGEEQVRIEYQTTAASPDLHWRTSRPDGRGSPFFYALSEPLGARGWVPLPDTPRARMTFRVHVHTPPRMVALLSGAHEASADGGEAPDAKRAADHWLVVDRPVAADRLDLVVADLRFDRIGPQDGVYAAGWSARREARALADEPAVRAAAQRLLGRAGAARRDFVVMPADFPHAAVVAPGLTLLSPTLLSSAPHRVPLAARLPYGDADSLIEPAGRRDRWIGRAFSAYLQSRVVEALYGAPQASDSDTLAFLRLRGALAAVPAAAQALEADPAARGAAGQTVEYGKGRLLLDFLDASCGRARFDALMRAFFARDAGRPVSTDEFTAFVAHSLGGCDADLARPGALDAWLHDPGIPQDAALPDGIGLRGIDAVRDGWLAERSPAARLATRGWCAEDWEYFLASLPPTIGADRLAALDAASAPMRAADAAVEASWLRLAARAGYRPALASMPTYLQSVGRVDLVVPLYAALMASPDGARLARRVYSAARAGYDPLATALIAATVAPPTGNQVDSGREEPE